MIKIPTGDQLATLIPELDWLDDCTDEMVSLVLELCNLNSGTRNLCGIKDVTKVLMREYEKLGGEITAHPVEKLKDTDEAGNDTEVELGQLVQIIKRPEVRPRVLLCIHMDTVYPKNSPFQSCVENEPGVLNGPGVADAKGGLVVMLYSLLALEKMTCCQNIGWEVIMNADEELGSPGSAKFLQSRAREADIGLLFEPKLPDGTLVSTRKGVGNFTFVVRGRSAHSGREFEKGRNAIVSCSKLMQKIHGMNRTGEVILNVGKISGGNALNVVPDLAIGRVNVRVNSLDLADETRQSLFAAAKEFESDGISIEVRGGFTSMPKEDSEELRLLRKRIESCGEALRQPIMWRHTGGASDGNKFAAAGLPNIDTLGPKGGEIHSFNEYLNVNSLGPSAKLTALTMASLAIGR